MPEGDTIHRTAVVLRRALGGKIVTRFDITAPKVSAAARTEEIDGAPVDESSMSEPLRAAGFVRTPRGYLLRSA